jgi:hypothetical protein
MFWKKTAIETPLNSVEYEKLSLIVIDLNTQIKLLKGDFAGLELEMVKIKNKLNQRNGKTPEESSAYSSGLPTTTKGLNSFNPFL